MGRLTKYPPFLDSEYGNGNESSLFHVLPVPMEKSVSYGGGTRKGPSSILKASSQLEVYDGWSCPGEEGIRTLAPVNCRGPVEKVLDRIAVETETILNHESIPVLLGGEHTVTNGAFRALKSYCEGNTGKVGIVQIDAHGDLRNSYEGSIYSHACVMRRAFEMGFPIFQLGIRSLSPEEIELRKGKHIPCMDGPALCKGNPVNEVELPGDFPEEVYLTIDVDGLDPSIIPGTGTPEPGGLGWYQTINLIESIAGKRRIIGFDCVELAPLKGSSISEFTAARLVYQVMGIISRSRK